MKNLFFANLFVITLLIIGACKVVQPEDKPSKGTTAEILYHVCQRSFYDSNGDLHGDLKGLEQMLDYLQELGITSILLLPLYESVYYHNYFPIDFEKIDPEFGTEADYLSLVKAVHDRGMKLYMDMEIHYITEDHLWFKDSYQNPESEYTDYIIYNDSLNEDYESIIFNLKSLTGYDGVTKKITTLNLYNEKCKRYIYDLFHYWLDPNEDGNFEDGVDGYRIDHMMDDLDWKNGLVANMLTEYWQPLFQELKAINKNISIIGEQANWNDYGTDYFSKADIDYMFAFNIKTAILDFDKEKIINKADSTWLLTPEGKNQLIFIENHDTDRFASKVNGDFSKAKVGAAFNLLLKGIPAIYYGQELGMKGEGGFGKYGNTDANDIPRREAFEWFETIEKPGMALWYKESGPWWTETSLKDSDGISWEEQNADDNSLWNFYKSLIELRKANSALEDGTQQFIENENESVVSFLRQSENQSVLIQINLSNELQTLNLKKANLSENTSVSIIEKWGETDFQTEGESIRFSLNPFAVQVFEVVH